MSEEKRDQEMEKIRLELARLSAELATLAARGEGAAGSGQAGEFGAAAQDQAGLDWEKIRTTLDEAQSRGEKGLKELSAHIERHPIGSAVAAFGLGFVIARLLGGGRRS